MPETKDGQGPPGIEGDLDKQLAQILPPEKKEEVERLLMSHVSYSGPLPPASEFAKYESALAGSSDRILRMAESSLGHANKIESVSLWGEIILSALGQILGALLVLAVVSSGFYLILNGYPIPGTAITLTGSVAGVVGHVIRGRSVLFGAPNHTNLEENKPNNQKKPGDGKDAPRRRKR